MLNRFDAKLLLVFVILLGMIALVTLIAGGCRSPDEVTGGLAVGRGTSSTDGILNFGPPKAVSLSSDHDSATLYGELTWYQGPREVRVLGYPPAPPQGVWKQEVAYLPPERPVLAPKLRAPEVAPEVDPEPYVPPVPVEAVPEEPVEGVAGWKVALGTGLGGAVTWIIMHWPQVLAFVSRLWRRSPSEVD